MSPVTVAAADDGGRPWAAAFRHRDFRLFQAMRVLVVLGTQMQSVAIGWQIYSITGRALDLAWVGLAQFLPTFALSLVTGHVADRIERQRILMVCYGALAALSATLFVVARSGHVGPIYAVLAGVGVARAFLGPASQSLLPTLVPAEDFRNAVAWSSSIWQATMIVAPTLGGLVYAASGGAGPAYAASAACSLGALFTVAAMSIARAAPRTRSASLTLDSVFAGVKYVLHNQVLLGAISLDLFAVLLGGATALLPIYARDILHLGPWGLGVLRSAPAAGAAVTGVVLAMRPIASHAGAKMLGCVAIFGLATIVFGLSHSFALSLVALVVSGASDMVSVVVRSALVQIATPDEMRGRVSAVNLIFVGASNELGEFESGVVAQWLGATASVVLGGIGTLLVVAIWAWRFPRLRDVDR